MDSEQKVALVTGGSRGLGLATAEQLARRGYQVVLSARTLGSAQTAIATLASSTGIHPLELDVTRSDHIAHCVEYLDATFGRLDVLINNAGIYPLNGDSHNRALHAPFGDFDAGIEHMREAFEINTLAPIRLVRAVMPLMLRGGYGRVVNLSSALGQLSGMSSGSAAYRVSKTALNAATRILAAEVDETVSEWQDRPHGAPDIKINAASPGWVRTDMGGPDADRSIDEGVQGILTLAMLPQDGPSGGFFRDGAALDW